MRIVDFECTKCYHMGARKGKDDEIKLFRGRRGRHLCWKRLEVFVCVRMVSAEASAQEMTAEKKEVSMIEYKLSLASSGAVKAPGYEDVLRFGYNKNCGVYRLRVTAADEWKGKFRHQDNTMPPLGTPAWQQLVGRVEEVGADARKSAEQARKSMKQAESEKKRSGR